MSFHKFLLLIFFTVPSSLQVPATGDMRQAKADYAAGSYVPALRKAVTVYGKALQSGNDSLAADAGNLIGLVYLAQGQASNAMRYFRQAAVTNAGNRQYYRVAANQLNIAQAFSDLKRSDSALVYAGRCLALSQKIGAFDLVAMAANHLGDFESHLNHPAKAERYFKTVITNSKFQSDWENSFAYTGLARLRFNAKDFRAAGGLADRAYRLADKVGAKWDAARALDIAQQAYHAGGDQSAAYDRLRLFKAYSDSLTSVDKTHESNLLQIREKTMENTALQTRTRLDAQQSKIDHLVIIISALAALLLGAIVIWTLRRNQRAKRQNIGLVQLNKEKDRLFSIIGHDLRSPFATLQTTMQLLSSGDLSHQEVAGISRQLTDQLEAASIMLDSLLIWAGKQLQGMTAHPQQLDLPVKVNKVIALLTPGAERKKVRIKHHFSGLRKVSGDPDHVRIMIQNILANAIKFTPEGGTVEISYLSGGKIIEMRISDTGVGMPAEILQTILSSASPNRSTYGTANEKGIGLGMLLVRDFAHRNGIGLAAESDPGKGTTFRLTFSCIDTD
ncbi:hypothetical protein D0C36_20150 [Mucilaginibacter conchicola]|uniref:histidine kinase n=1 Tax=Mucilaginibacter conchicola TaxID=2303333 RepID=A0A372NQM5_9SPHI|nr:tetratricopeptide repeat-containing sensor histidine kinase [Mucilaginibacter conchicola]RFZ91249.1 hypothetical protein D0C36_20150 [Mucilaginibacter conchicola]